MVKVFYDSIVFPIPQSKTINPIMYDNISDVIEQLLGKIYCDGLDCYINYPPKYIEINDINNQLIYEGKIEIPNDIEIENLYFDPHLTEQQINDIINSEKVTIKESTHNNPLTKEERDYNKALYLVQHISGKRYGDKNKKTKNISN